MVRVQVVLISVVVGMQFRFATVPPLPMHALVAVFPVYTAAIAPSTAVYPSYLWMLQLKTQCKQAYQTGVTEK